MPHLGFEERDTIGQSVQPPFQPPNTLSLPLCIAVEIRRIAIIVHGSALYCAHMAVTRLFPIESQDILDDRVADDVLIGEFDHGDTFATASLQTIEEVFHAIDIIAAIVLL